MFLVCDYHQLNLYGDRDIYDDKTKQNLVEVFLIFPYLKNLNKRRAFNEMRNI